MTFKILVTLVFACIIGGCGQSGPLYIPGNPSTVAVPPPPPEPPAEEADQEAGKD